MQRILSAAQIREADRQTIEHEPVKSIDLMERAANACMHWIRSHIFAETQIRIFCGPGNNGGDGAALARLLSANGYSVTCYSFGNPAAWSEDRRKNDDRLLSTSGITSSHIHDSAVLPIAGKGECWIDALFGTGMSRPIEGLFSEVIARINRSEAEVIAIDLPSGMFADRHCEKDAPVVRADHTLTFHAPKLSFFLAESGPFAGSWHVLDIGLDSTFCDSLPTRFLVPEWNDVKGIFRPRHKFSHKGTYGHGLLLAGSKGKYGAALLSAQGALRSGIGLLTIQAPRSGELILQTGVPEAMYLADSGVDHLAGPYPEAAAYKAAGIGPGCGTDPSTVHFIRSFVRNCPIPLVVDADGINAIAGVSMEPGALPMMTVFTPHPKEFERLTHPVDNDLERLKLLQEFAQVHQVVVVLKGACTRIALPDGRVFFNTTGNAGLARGGSGDLLTGIILSFLAQGYAPEQAALLGVFIHGASADRVAARSSMQSLALDDVLAALPEIFSELEK